MMQMLGELSSRLESLKCAAGHNCKVRYVQTAKKAHRRFLCEECLHQSDTIDQQDKLMDLRDYIRGLSSLATNQETQMRSNQAFSTETETGLEVTDLLCKDLVDSLGGIKTMVEGHYSELLTRITRNATKCTRKAIPPIEKDLKRQLFELGSIEKNLKIMKEGGNPADICQIIDQAIAYTNKKTVADNGLYHLLTGLNPYDAAQSTHVRLSNFSNKYLGRKRHLIEGVKTVLEARFKRDERMLQEFIEQRKKILTNIDSYLTAAQKLDEETKNDRNSSQLGHEETRIAMRKALSRFGLNSRNNEDQFLGKRRNQTPDYDPKISFEKKFGSERLPTYEDQMNRLRVSGTKGNKNRLTEALKSRKPTLQSRFYSSNGQTNSNSNQNRFKSKKSLGQPIAEDAIEVSQTALEIGTGLFEVTTNVLQPRNTNTSEQLASHPYKKNVLQEDTLKSMPSRRTAQSYLDYLAKEKKKEEMMSCESRGPNTLESFKENQSDLFVKDIHEKNEELQRVMLEVPIKKLNVNDPRRRTITQMGKLGTHS